MSSHSSMNAYYYKWVEFCWKIKVSYQNYQQDSQLATIFKVAALEKKPTEENKEKKTVASPLTLRNNEGSPQQS